MVVPSSVPPLGLSQLRSREPQEASPPIEPSQRLAESWMTQASKACVESFVDSRVEQLLSSGGGVPSWVARTCHQGAEASALTAVAVQQAEESRRQLEAEVRSISESVAQLVVVVDGLTGDAERQSSNTDQVRHEALCSVQRVISTVDGMQKAMGQEGDGILHKVRQVSVELEDLRTRQVDEATKFRTELSDLRRLQAEASHQQRSCGEELAKSNCSLAELRREMQSCQRDVHRLDSQSSARHAEAQLQLERFGLELTSATESQQLMAQRLDSLQSTALQLQREAAEVKHRMQHLEKAFDNAAEQRELQGKNLKAASQKLEKLEANVCSETDIREQHHSAFELRSKEFDYVAQQARAEHELREQQHAAVERRLLELEASALQRQWQEAVQEIRSELQTLSQSVQDASTNLKQQEEERERDNTMARHRLQLLDHLVSECTGRQEKQARMLDALQEEVQLGRWRLALEEQRAASEQRLRRLEEQLSQGQRFAKDKLAARDEEHCKLEQRMRQLDERADDCEKRCHRITVEMEKRLLCSEAALGEAMGELHGKQFQDLRSRLLDEQGNMEKHLRSAQQKLKVIEARVETAVKAEELELFIKRLNDELADSVRLARSSAESKVARELREDFRREFRRLVESLDTGFQEELSNVESDLVSSLQAETRSLITQPSKAESKLHSAASDSAETAAAASASFTFGRRGRHMKSCSFASLDEVKDQRLKEVEKSDCASVTTEITPEVADRMSRELDLFMGLSATDAARIFMKRASSGMSA